MSPFHVDIARFRDPAHLLSLSRVPLAALVWLRPGDPLFLMVVVLIAGATDVLDGLIGRRIHRGQTDDIGSWLDPLCDKVFAVSAAVAVVVVWPVSWLLLPLLLVRDMLTLVLAAVFWVVDPDTFARHDFHARLLGKATTVLQTACIVAAVLLPDLALPLAVFTAIVGGVAVLDRVHLAQLSRRRPV